MGLGPHSAAGVTMIPFFYLGIVRPDPRQVPWSNWTTPLVLQKSKAAGWDYYWGSSGRNLVCQDLSASCYNCLYTYLLTIRFQVVEPLRFPWNLRRKKPGLDLPTILRGLDDTPGLSFFPLEVHRLRGDLLHGTVLARGRDNVVSEWEFLSPF